MKRMQRFKTMCDASMRDGTITNRITNNPTDFQYYNGDRDAEYGRNRRIMTRCGSNTFGEIPTNNKSEDEIDIVAADGDELHC